MSQDHESVAPNLTLVIGGARSGKSALVERLAHATGRPVLFAATMEGRDDEVRSRIEAHRRSRPQSWRTIEEPVAVVEALQREATADDAVIVDCLTLWVANLLQRDLPDPEAASIAETSAAEDGAVTAARALVAWVAQHDGVALVVTNEVGMGLVPPYRLGRVFRDALGRANATIAAAAGRVYQVHAGLVLDLKALGARPVDAHGEAPPPSSGTA